MNLWQRVEQATALALASGALTSIPTRQERIHDGGVDFSVRVVDNLARKEPALSPPTPQANPFLPFDRDLYVADLGASHVLLLNKYNVMDHHVLVVTRRFEEQESWLTEADFAALSKLLHVVDGLGFYNAGKVAGASQRHKHLQLLPLPLGPEGPRVPIEPALKMLPFRHALGWLHSDSPSAAAGLYRQLMSALNLSEPSAYNLLMTREWMLAVPRRQEQCGGISVNALGFAGTLLLRVAGQLEQLRRLGPMQILCAVAGRADLP